MDQKLIVHKASIDDILEIEDILLDAIHRLRFKKLDNLWNEENTSWKHMSKSYEIGQFYIGRYEDKSVGCMALTDYDETYWPQVPRGEAIYLHKLAIKRLFVNRGYSEEFISYAKEYARKMHCKLLRLDCNGDRLKLRALYDNQGFTCVKEICINDYRIALYEYLLN